MRCRVISVGQRMPRWVRDGYEEYARRMPGYCRLELVEIPPARRGKGADIGRLVRTEGERILHALPSRCRVVALDRGGRQRTTAALAEALGGWMAEGRDLALLIGGADGLSAACLERADEVWSLSRLTFAHPLVRVLVAEQLYRAWSLTRNMPYHRA